MVAALPELATPRRRAASLPPDERRSAIIATTIPLLLEHGESITSKQIADAAGIAEGTIFRVFTDKETLLGAVLDAALDPAPLERALLEVDPTGPLLDVVVDAVRICQHRVTESWQLLSSLGHRVHDRGRRPMAESPALAQLLETHRDELTEPPRDAARHLRALTFALTHPMLVERPVAAPEIARVFLHGAAKRATPC